MASLDFGALSDSEIRQKLIAMGETNIGPVNSRTRKPYMTKLQNLISRSQKALQSPDKYDPKYISHKDEETDNGPAISPLKRGKMPVRGKGRKSSLKRNDSSVSPNSGSPKLTPGRRKRTAPETTANGMDFMDTDQMPGPSRDSSPPPYKMSRDNMYYTFRSPTQLNSTIDSDENQDFGNMVAKKLGKYDTIIQNIIQNEIMSIFIRADSGCYDR